MDVGKVYSTSLNTSCSGETSISSKRKRFIFLSKILFERSEEIGFFGNVFIVAILKIPYALFTRAFGVCQTSIRIWS